MFMLIVHNTGCNFVLFLYCKFLYRALFKLIIDIDSSKWITKESAFELLSAVKLYADRVGPLSYIGYLSKSTPLPNKVANSQLLYQVQYFRTLISTTYKFWVASSNY